MLVARCGDAKQQLETRNTIDREDPEKLTFIISSISRELIFVIRD
jgi:hypothetical protein